MAGISDKPIRGFRQNLDFLLRLIASTLSPFGSILTAPQITAWTKGEPTNILLLVGGVALMLFSLVGIPAFLAAMKNHLVEKGATGRFVKHVDECVRAMNDYSLSRKSGSDVEILIQKLTTEATYIIGNQARVCLYWKATKEEDSEPRYDLLRENTGERMPRSQARKFFCSAEGKDHQSFINAMDSRSERVVVQDVEKPPFNFTVSPNRANEYGSFILVPIRSTDGADRYRKTVGVLTVDFPGRKIITTELESVASAIAEMFSLTLKYAHDTPFKNGENSGQNDFNGGIINLVQEQGGD